MHPYSSSNLTNMNDVKVTVIPCVLVLPSGNQTDATHSSSKFSIAWGQVYIKSTVTTCTQSAYKSRNISLQKQCCIQNMNGGGGGAATIFRLHDSASAACTNGSRNVLYRRTGFDCEYRLNANCEFFYDSQSFNMQS